MDCDKVKSLLDQYIDKNLEKNMLSIIEKHLSSCKECSSEFVYLKKYRKEMASLEPVKAPPDFIKSLNQRIDGQSFFSKLARAIFIPLKIKLPVEVAGVLATVVLIIILFRPAERIKEIIPVYQKPEYAEKDSAKDIKITKRTQPESTYKNVLSIGEKQKKERIYARSEIKPVSMQRGEIKTYEIALILHKPVKFRKINVNKLAEISSESSAPEEESDVKVSNRVIDDEYKARLYKEKSGFDKPAITGEGEDVSESRIRYEKEYQSISIERTTEEIKNIVLSVNGRVILEDLNKENGGLPHIIVEISAGNQKEFMNKLSLLGLVRQDQDKHTDINKSKDIRYKIGIIQNE